MSSLVLTERVFLRSSNVVGLRVEAPSGIEFSRLDLTTLSLPRDSCVSIHRIMGCMQGRYTPYKRKCTPYALVVAAGLTVRSAQEATGKAAMGR